MRHRIIIVLTAFVILVAGSLAVLYVVNRSPQVQNAVYRATNTTLSTKNVNDTNRSVVKPAVINDHDEIIFVVRNFTERYGSFSNQNNGINLITAQDFATPAYTSFLSQQVKNIQATNPATEYSGTVTKALTFSFTSQSTATAQVLVSAQQTVTTGQATKVKTGELLVDLQKLSGSWKVNAAVWK